MIARSSMHLLVAVSVVLLVSTGCSITPVTPDQRVTPPNAQLEVADNAARAAMAARMQGIWTGTFKRYDAAGVLTQTLPSEVQVRFYQEKQGNPPHHYHQTNSLTLPDGTVQKIESFGVWDGRVLRFANSRIEGWYTEIEADKTGLNSVLSIAYKDGSGLTMSEIITLAPDGSSRMRVAQYSIAGKLVRRTLIEETRSSNQAK